VTLSLPSKEIIENVADRQQFEQFENSSILITGATGFVGSWLSGTLAEANLKHNLGMKILLLSRNIDTLKNQRHSNFVSTLRHDIRNALPAGLPHFDYVFHTATPSNPSTGGTNVDLVLEITVNGTKNLLSHLSSQKTPAHLLNTSSGAVDKLNPHVVENPLQTAYRCGKEESEKLVNNFHNRGNIIGTNPRLYTFAGPGIPTDAHFVAGEFIRLAMNNEPIVIKGNPNTERSYMYPSDLVSWLLTIIINPSLEVIRVGSPNAIKISELARIVFSTFNLEDRCFYGDENLVATKYVPDLTETIKKYSLKSKVDTFEIFERWKNYLSAISN
jgi:nucleoside-diphosphate-sugar epimerase